MLDETDIQKLLRLKRHEQPPPGYFDTFLQDFHRRQRAELLKQPAWKIAFERLGAFFSDHSMGRMAYASATVAVLLFAGVASFNILNSGGSSNLQVAVNTPSTPAAQPSVVLPLSGPLPSQYASATLPEPTNVQVMRPHYVIDSRPVSYERPFSF